MDFTNKTGVARTINDFVSDRTHGKIKDFIKPQIITNDAAVLLVNAVYFHDEWIYKFDKANTVAGNFYINENETVRVDYMTTTDYFHYKWIHKLKASVLEMKYANPNNSFIIVLPWDRTGLAKLEKQLKNFDLMELTNFDRVYNEKVTIKIPTFKAQHELKLNDILKKVCNEKQLKCDEKRKKCVMKKIQIYILLLVGYGGDV